MSRRKALPKPNPFRRWSIGDGIPESARRASLTCIRHFVRKAAEERAVAIAMVADPLAMARVCGMMQSNYRRVAVDSVHVIARQAMEYHRMRAHLGVREGEGGSYAPVGWPMDRPMRESWMALNP